MLKLTITRNRESGALRRRLKAIAGDLDPNSGKMDYFRRKISDIRKLDNIDMLTHRGEGAYAGEDRFGRGLAYPAESTIESRKDGFGMVLAPRGLGSTTITNFFTRWSRDGGSVWRFLDGWRGIPWIVYHLEGRPKGSKPSQPNWSLPQRDIGGFSLKGLVKARQALADLRNSILRKGSA